MSDLKSHLQDVVKNTTALGIDLVKINGTKDKTSYEAIAEDRTLIMHAESSDPIPEFIGTFGMPNLSKLNTILGIPEYKEEAQITLKTQVRNDETIPVGLHFENKAGDFESDYRFMSQEIVSDKLKSVKFKGVKWNVEFSPTVTNINRLNY